MIYTLKPYTRMFWTPPPVHCLLAEASALRCAAGKVLAGMGGTSMSLASHMATPLKPGGLHGLAMLRPPTATLTGMGTT